ncbi:hypothetical protein HII12_001963 [Brettanomyces bruxellensis]|uniref:DEBR0S1_01332g1_1 n=1 Tax=Dekkera bruxellensis TaxID=5007 RepID=A0A7D9GX36_DEKBR|nr:hypothetical protein HII12_001963 [Brettanomyces bruxellensis]VUG15842.1 BTS1 [Brettanomyces bruxellensis]
MSIEAFDFDESSCGRTQKYEELVKAPFAYITGNTKGKSMRKKLMETYNLLLNVPRSRLSKLEELVNLLHLSSLLIDDVEDSSDMRRGKPCAHKIFGSASAVNCSGFMYFKALELATEIFNYDGEKREKAVSIFMEELLNLHYGQGLDLYWRDNFICPTEQEYVMMVWNKTGGLFRLSTRLMELASGKSVPDLVKLSNLLGVLYQIKDDYLNLKSSEYRSKKGFCEDITEGKFSFPVVYSITTCRKSADLQSEAQELIDILRLRTKDTELKVHCVEIMERVGALDHSLNIIHKLQKKADALVSSIMDKNQCDEVTIAAFNAIMKKLGEV